MAYWVSAPSADDDFIEDLEHFNCPAELRDELLEEQKDVFDIYPSNWKVWNAFLAISTQLKESPKFGVLGFDYTGVKSGFAMAGIELKPDEFYKFQRIETELAAKLNERK